jgi:hypothetical protein
MRSTSQLISPGAPSAPRVAGLSRLCPAYGLPRVRELPLRLEPVAPDTFGGLVGRGSTASCVVSLTNHPRGALS